MAYAKISNLYANQDILLFKECYALEKIHGTSAHIRYMKDNVDSVTFFSGGADHNVFADLFNVELLKERFEELGLDEVVVYGEAYGGKMQGMQETYGPDLRFVVFEVKIGETWLAVPDMAEIGRDLGLDVIPYEKISTELIDIDRERDKPSELSRRLGISSDRPREGVVLRPLIEMRRSNGKRIVAKHKGDQFRETKTPRKVDEKQLEILDKANEVAMEWVTEMRLSHVLDKVMAGIELTIEHTGIIVKAMVSDVITEAGDEIVVNPTVKKAIGKRAAGMFKNRIKSVLYDS